MRAIVSTDTQPKERKMTLRAARPCLIVFALAAGASFAQTTDSLYGQEKRAIKALSEKEMDDYLNGRGMGTSKAAELNRYPGPRHVLDEAVKLGLGDKQVAKTTEIYKTMERDAIQLGRQIVHKEAELDALFAKSLATPEKLQKIVSELAELQGQYRLVHLNAHLSMRSILSAEQISMYDKVRGYGGAQSPAMHHRHH